MRKCVVAVFVLVLTFGGVPAIAYPPSCYEKEKNSSSHKAGDWFATFGKNPKEKERILVKRKRDRIAACAKKVLESGPWGKAK
jgi:hypothetical protein